MQRKVVSPNDFTDLDQVEDRLTAFEHRYNATARPFKWKFTPADLDDLLARIDQHQTAAPTYAQPHDHPPTNLGRRPLSHRLDAVEQLYRELLEGVFRVDVHLWWKVRLTRSWGHPWRDGPSRALVSLRYPS